MLAKRQPCYWPSTDPDYQLVIMTGASGGYGTATNPGSWSALLGQYRGTFNPECISAACELLQTEGGVFNSRQASWDILRKEAVALFQAFYRFQQYIWGRKIRFVSEFTVLMVIFRSENWLSNR